MKGPLVTILFLAVQLCSYSASGQGPDGCPSTKPAKAPIEKPVNANGFVFSYHSLVFEVGEKLWCHDRRIANQGPPVYVEWKDNLGPILGQRHLLAGPKGVVRGVAWESGDTDDVPAVIGYGPWDPDTYSEPTRVYRSMSELKNKPVIDAKKKAFLPMISGLDAVVLNGQSQTHRIGIRLYSEVQGESGSLKILYSLASRKEAATFLIAQPDRVPEGVSVVLGGKIGKIVKPGLRVYSGDSEKFGTVGIQSVEIENFLIEVLVDGKSVATARISAYVSAD